MQREFTLVMISLLMVSTLAIGFVIHETIREVAYGSGFHFGRVSPIEVLSEVRYELILRVSLILFASLIVLGTFGVFFLHRVAGPVYRFRQIFLRVNRGETKEIEIPVQLREGDFFHETAMELNRIIRRIRSDEEKVAIAKDKVARILSLNPSGGTADLARELQDVLNRQVD